MCNLVTLKTSIEEVAQAFFALADRNTNAAPGDVYPGYQGFVVREDDGQRKLQAMTWGFPRQSLNKKTGRPNKPNPVNNAREDKLMSAHGMWKRWFTDTTYRCLIPFTAFAEAEGEPGRMTKTWINVADQPLAAWAGLWRPSNEWGHSYTGVMVDATKELWHIHDRMPVILNAEDHDRWLHAPAAEALTLLRQYPADRLSVEQTGEPWSSRRAADTPLLL
ncbi:SOS response-associated peptidase [Blastomonas aquatica]|nr:SOS response-associated peptidase family protein [Blastomonas aquatica]